jgi:hypothetical protein
MLLGDAGCKMWRTENPRAPACGALSINQRIQRFAHSIGCKLSDSVCTSVSHFALRRTSATDPFTVACDRQLSGNEYYSASATELPALTDQSDGAAT